MFDMSAFASAKEKVNKRRVATSGSAYEQAVIELEEFSKNPDKESLEIAGEKLVEALKFSPDNPEAYICLAYIFYVLEDDEFAWKYINLAESYLEYLPDEIQSLKDEIEDNLPWLKNKQNQDS